MLIFRLKKKEKKEDGWFGNYENWQELTAMSGGYQAQTILDITKNSLLKVKNGEAVYERDSVVFDKKLYPYSIISALLYAAVECDGSLTVLDFGGSLGSTYYQVKDLIPSAVKLHWSVVEQKEYVACGQDLFEDEILKFHYTIAESMSSKRADVLILSSVVQYLEKPHDFLNEIMAYGFKYIILDRTSFIKNDQPDRLTLQIVPKHIYEAQYPAWFFNEKKLMKHFDEYQIKTEFESYVPGEQNIKIDSVEMGYDKGFFLIKN